MYVCVVNAVHGYVYVVALRERTLTSYLREKVFLKTPLHSSKEAVFGDQRRTALDAQIFL